MLPLTVSHFVVHWDTVSTDTHILPPHFRWNFAAFLTDYVCFSVAFTFVSFSTVMPALVGQLTSSAPVIGLVGAIFNGGWLLPQLAVAQLVNDKPYKKPYMLIGLTGRVTLWAIALGLWAGLARRPTAMLTLFFVCIGLFAVTDGLASVAWFDILARAIPLRRRGRLVGMSQFISGLIGIGVGALVGLTLEQRPFPDNYALLFTLAGLTLVPSVIALALIKEPPPQQNDSPTTGSSRDWWLKILTNDSTFRRLILCRILVGMLGLASSFYVVHAANALHLPSSIIGGFVVAQTTTGIIASPVLGWISERWGPHHVARLTGAASLIGPLFALLAHLAGDGWLVRAYPIVYVALGFVNNAVMPGFMNYMLEIAPEGMCPAYIGLGNTILGVLTLVPMVGGWLLEATSYTTLFGVTSAFVLIGFLLSLSLKRPQQALPQAPS
ncbi:MAG TPA: MFS transporter [Chloroflexi bacterium]|nr:MFS transporter [Chloroflexota bacterium]